MLRIFTASGVSKKYFIGIAKKNKQMVETASQSAICLKIRSMCTVEYKWNWKRPLTYFVLSLIPIVGFWVELDVKKIINGQKK